MIGAIIAKKVAQSGFSNLNKGNIDGFTKAWAEEAVFVYPPGVAASGTIEGRENIRKWFAKWMEQFPKRNFVLKNVCVKNIFDLIGSNVVSVEWDVNLTNKDGKDFVVGGVTTIDVRKGKAVRVCDYIADTAVWKEAWGEK
jgi:ketosteroid isomerase-like protein